MTTDSKRGMVPEDLYRIVWIEDAQVSADGRRVAFVRKWMDPERDGYRSEIWVAKAAAGAQPSRFTTGPAEDSHPRWSPDGSWLAFLSNRAGDKKQIWLLPSAGGEARRLTDQGEGVQGFVWAPDSGRIAFVARVRARPADADGARAPTRIITSLKYRFNGEGFVYDRRPHIFVLNIHSGQTTQVTDGDYHDEEPCWSPDGQTIAFSSARHADHDFDTLSDIYLVAASGGKPRCITNARGAAQVPSYSPDGRTIAYLGHLGPHPGGSKNLVLWVTNPDGGEARELTRALDRTAVADVRPIWAPDSAALLIGLLDHGSVGLHAVPADGGGARPLVAGRRLLTSWSCSSNGSLLAYAGSTPTQPAEAFAREMGDWLTGIPEPERRLTTSNATWLEEVELSEPEPFNLALNDGLELEGWVMRPALTPNDPAPPERIPALLNVHGGPHAYYGWGFFDEFQVQAGAGYGVVYLNPRGSQGYGEAFARACCGDWGGGDFDDLMTGLDAALEVCPSLDRDRIGVLGGSYGGFMTSWIVGHTNRFRAAASERAVNAPVSLFGTSDIGFWFEEFEIGGNPLTNLEVFTKRSPLSYVAQISTPLLILHSENDLRCPIEQAEQLYVALKLQRRADVVFVRFPEETHELTRTGKPSRRVERFQILLDWFDRYIRPGENWPLRSPTLHEAIRAGGMAEVAAR